MIVAPGSAWVAVVRDVPVVGPGPRVRVLLHDSGWPLFERCPESTGPLFARRETAGYHDEIYLDGFDDSCHATWARKSSFIVPGGLSITARVTGDPLTVLHTVVSDWPPP